MIRKGTTSMAVKAPSKLLSRLGEVWRQDFTVFRNDDDHPSGQRLAFLDSAASAQKPECVLEAMAATLEGPYANIHRGLYTNSATTTTRFEAARATIATFVNAPVDGTIFTRNSTEGINLVAQTWGRTHLNNGKAVLLTQLEHHANIVPWQLLQAELGFEIRVADIHDDGNLNMADVAAKLKDGKVAMVAFTAMSNVLGVRTDTPALIAVARKAGAAVLVDASQAVVHGPVDFTALDADFMVFTGHKLYGPTGIGVLVGKSEILNTLPPYQGGGDMIETVSFKGTTYAPSPARFEAGTPAFVEAIALAAALEYVTKLGWKDIQKHEASMAAYLDTALDDAMVLRYGMAGRGNGIAAFNLPKCHPHDVATVLDQHNVAVRSGHHCAMPLMARLGLDGCLRASIGLYTVKDDIDQLVAGLHKAAKLLRK
ncbi:MAG: aminotransferase class V-fold PLP-dependent enzyme [Alphaproteobacteria bacterium]